MSWCWLVLPPPPPSTPSTRKSISSYGTVPAGIFLVAFRGHANNSRNNQLRTQIMSKQEISVTLGLAKNSFFCKWKRFIPWARKLKPRFVEGRCRGAVATFFVDENLIATPSRLAVRVVMAVSMLLAFPAGDLACRISLEALFFFLRWYHRFPHWIALMWEVNLWKLLFDIMATVIVVVFIELCMYYVILRCLFVLLRLPTCWKRRCKTPSGFDG